MHNLADQRRQFALESGDRGKRGHALAQHLRQGCLDVDLDLSQPELVPDSLQVTGVRSVLESTLLR
jgi:hypothetical protein